MTTSHFETVDALVVSPPEGGLSFIEQLHAECENVCQKENRPSMTGTNKMAKTAMLIRPNCKVWNCKSCAARNARYWIAKIINGVNKMDTENSWHMFTLTAHEKWRGRDKSVKNLRQGWKKLYNRIRRQFGVNYYVKVWEMHADGTFHLHGLIDAVIPTKWLKTNARQCGMGYQVEIHAVDNAGQVAGYICKYFLKSQGEITEDNQFPRNLRRIEVSRNWMSLPEPEGFMVFDWIINQTREGQLRNAAHLETIHKYIIVDRVNEP